MHVPSDSFTKVIESAAHPEWLTGEESIVRQVMVSTVMTAPPTREQSYR